ncbi:DUF1501 domain-containing protein [Limnoglobus roseus]|uniref:DUF1501 domain-containing protein n=1 Tax=Limnoglobus roseus TaxID=2598579 RepID=A0A5C1A8M2_9BACT|nr:DUF1501 domain-containing protein [Limnoglobus roseus]QEL13438.1 hypothetical protein PX52LOC_00295 [Limnoglobus roseus]
MPRPCRGPSRRDVLRAGTLAPLGLGLNSLFAATPSPVAKAKSVILLYMWGGPSQLDTWDPKPDAPAEVRGLFRPIATTVPGLQISEHFPELAKRAKRYTVIHSMAHTDPAHLSPTHHLLTGRLAGKVNSDADGPKRSDAPCIGAVVQKRFPTGAVPNAVTLPWAVSHPSAPGGQAPGQNAGWLGSGYDPFLVTGNPNSPTFAVGGLTAAPDVPPARLQSRADLCRQLDRGGPTEANADLRQKAIDLLLAPGVSRAFDLTAESPKTRDAYGRHTHGQSCLLARRLVEAGTKFVTVNWPDDGQNFWDTHGNNFPSLKNRLMPPADRAFAALLDDLTDRGLLDETLVVWVGEFGRTPRVVNAGREHWPRCYSAVVAGGGVRGGTIYGASDKIAAAPAENPVSPADLTATMYHALGIDPQSVVADRLGREITLTEGQPLRAIFG